MNSSSIISPWSQSVQTMLDNIGDASLSLKIPDTTNEQFVVLAACLDQQSIAPLDGLGERNFEGANLVVYKAVQAVIGPEGSVSPLAVSCAVPTTLLDYVNSMVGVEHKESLLGRANVAYCRKKLFDVEAQRCRIAAAFNILTANDALTALKSVETLRLSGPKPKGRVLSASMQLPRNPYILQYKSTPFVQRGGYYNLMGSQKSGKSHVFSMWLATLLGGRCGEFKCLEPNLRILYVDTEQNDVDFVGILRTANIIMGVNQYTNNSNLRAISVAHNDYIDILPIIQEEVDSFRPDVVFVDSFGGMIQDPNDKNASILVKSIRQFAQSKNIVIFGIIHTTPTAEKVKALGVFGSDLQRWSCGSFLNEKDDDGTFRLSSYEGRKMPFPDCYYQLETQVATPAGQLYRVNYEHLADEVNALGYKVNDVDVYAVPVPLDQEELDQHRDEKKEATLMIKNQHDFSDLNPKFAGLFPLDSSVIAYSLADLKKEFARRFYTGNSNDPESQLKFAARKIERALELGILFKNPDGTIGYSMRTELDNGHGRTNPGQCPQ